MKVSEITRDQKNTILQYSMKYFRFLLYYQLNIIFDEWFF